MQNCVIHFKKNYYFATINCRIRAGGGCLHEGGDNCTKYRQRGWNEKEGRGNKNLKKVGGGGQAGAGALKSEGLEPPYEL